MRLLLDTHVFLWLITADKRLPEKMREDILDSNNEVYLSVVSLWEISIKHQVGKLPLPESPETYLAAQSRRHEIVTLSVEESDVFQLANIPPIHRDPFDRMLVCQAMARGLTIVTVDALVKSYPVPIYDGHLQ